MAGSYYHVVNQNNKFIGIDLIENLGDAYEAIEEMYFMINYLAKFDKKKIEEAGAAYLKFCFRPNEEITDIIKESGGFFNDNLKTNDEIEFAVNEFLENAKRLVG